MKFVPIKFDDCATYKQGLRWSTNEPERQKTYFYGVPSGPKFNFWILLVLLAFDVVVLQFVLTSAIQHSSFQFLYSNWRFDIVCFTIQHPSLRNSTSKFTIQHPSLRNSTSKFMQINIQLWKMHVFDIQPQSSQWQSVWAQKTIKILPV